MGALSIRIAIAAALALGGASAAKAQRYSAPSPEPYFDGGIASPEEVRQVAGRVEFKVSCPRQTWGYQGVSVRTERAFTTKDQPAVANAILLVTFAREHREATGCSARKAALLAGETRLRPVLMTAGAMFLGLIPMALGTGEGGEQNAALARAVMGGIAFGTPATLLFVPFLYTLLRAAPVRAPSDYLEAAEPA